MQSTLQSVQRAPVDWKSRLVLRHRILRATLEQVIASYVEELDRSRTPSSRRTIRSSVLAFGRDFAGCQVSDVTTDCLVAWIKARIALEHAAKTIRRDVSVARGLFRHALEIGVLERNPLDSLPPGTLPQNRVRNRQRTALEVLELIDVARLLADGRIPWSRRFLWALLFWTGVRPAEAFGLYFSDFAQAPCPHGQLLIERQWDPRARLYVRTKTDRIRLAPVSAQLAPWLEQARSRFAARFGRRGAGGDILAPFEPARAGGELRPWVSDTALDWWRRDLELVGIPHPSTGPRALYCLRHTFATQAIRAGADWRCIEQITHAPDDDGRAADRSEFRRYVHLSPLDLYERGVSKLRLPEVTR